jgi:GH24 family phage-related lysozyme (muramidase)/uncharacterized protein YgiM (DUF1202 family)
MKLSDNGVELLKEFESLRLTPYKALPSEPYYTIGYGHYGTDVTADMRITIAQAEAYLRQDVGTAEAAVNKYCAALGLNQNQYDALVSFTYNCGAGNLQKLVKDRTKAQIAAALSDYCHAGGKVVAGLVRRRKREQELFNTPTEGASNIESEGGNMSKAQQAVDFAVAVAKDDTHGYDQIDRWGNPNYDCSGLVITAYERAGVHVKTNGATYTGNMRKVFLKTGFTDVISKVNVKTGAGLQVGDVLLHQSKHTALYIGGGQIVHASINEKGTATGGKSGDQTGKEICTRSYYNHPWDSVLRFTGDGQRMAAGFNAVGTVTVTGDSVNVRTGGGKSHQIIAVAHKGDVLQYDGTQQNGWYHVSINGVAGYISNNYSKPNAAQVAGFAKKVICTGNGVRIRKGGGTGCAILLTVNKGAVMYGTAQSKTAGIM